MEMFVVQTEKHNNKGWRKQYGVAGFCNLAEAEEWLNQRLITLCEEVYNYKQCEDDDTCWEDDDGNIRFMINDNYEPGFIFWYDDRVNELYTIEKYVKSEQKPDEWYNVVTQITELR